eukprot:jgi/Undpi1/13179/HiC_scaffold_8.g02841.m1
MNVCLQEASAKAVLAAADARKQADRRALERETHDAPGKAEINANRLHGEVDKGQALRGERDQRVGDVHNLEAVQGQESSRQRLTPPKRTSTRLAKRNSGMRIINRFRHASSRESTTSSGMHEATAPDPPPQLRLLPFPASPRPPTQLGQRLSLHADRLDITDSSCNHSSNAPLTGTPGETLKSTGVPLAATGQENYVKATLATPGPESQCNGRWFEGYAVNIDEEVNGYGTSWMVVVLTWAAQSPHRLALLVQKLEAAGCPGGAFGGLEDRSKEELSTLCQPVELIMEMPTAICRSLQDPGDEVNPIASDIVRPAGSMGRPASLIVDSHVQGQGRSSQVLLTAQNVTNLLSGGRKALLCVLVLDTSRTQWKTLQQQGGHKRRALTESILQAGATREVETKPAAS